MKKAASIGEERLAAALRAAAAVIAYTPIAGEPDFSDFLKGKGVDAEIIRLPAKREADPTFAASELAAAHAEEPVLLFIPGREFDASGTRHGRGGGWYDRFLSAVPREWLRVGVLNVSQLSADNLKREPWDEPMDMLLVREGDSWRTLQVESRLKKR